MQLCNYRKINRQLNMRGDAFISGGTEEHYNLGKERNAEESFKGSQGPPEAGTGYFQAGTLPERDARHVGSNGKGNGKKGARSGKQDSELDNVAEERKRENSRSRKKRTAKLPCLERNEMEENGERAFMQPLQSRKTSSAKSIMGLHDQKLYRPQAVTPATNRA